VLRARLSTDLSTDKGATAAWKGKALRTCQRRDRSADALIAAACLAGMIPRRVRRARGPARRRRFRG
jgi:hypothetical protein